MENENKELSEREIRQTIMASAVGAAFIGGSATLVFPFLPLYLMELGAAPETVALWNSAVVSGMFIVGALVMQEDFISTFCLSRSLWRHPTYW